MVEWGVTPDYINRHWTEELLTLLFVKRTRRIERMVEAAESDDPAPRRPKRVSESQLFEKLGIKPNVVN